MQRPSNVRFQRLWGRTPRELRAALIELNERALDLLLVRLLREAGEGKEQQQRSGALHWASTAHFSRMSRANSSTVRPSATRSSSVCMMVLAAITWMPSERTDSA